MKPARLALAILIVFASLGFSIQSAPTRGSRVIPTTGPLKAYKDGRPAAYNYEKANKTLCLFTNHIGIDDRGEYTDAVWVYWSKDLNKWNRKDGAIVLDGRNCTWTKDCIGMPSVVQVGQRLAVLYDAPGGTNVSHMKRDIGLAWLDLPLIPPPGK